MSNKHAAEVLEENEDELAMMATAELLEANWHPAAIATALSRPQDWIDAAIDQLAARAAGQIVH